MNCRLLATLLTLPLFGCTTHRVVERPYGQVRTVMTEFARQINFSREPSPFADVSVYLEHQNRDASEWSPHASVTENSAPTAFIVSIAEAEPGSVSGTYTRIRAEPVDHNRTKITVSSRETGLVFDSRRSDLEKIRMRELLSALKVSQSTPFTH